jgi:hypothetical protein
VFEQAHRVRVHEPEIGEHEARFRWEVTPATELYHRTDFGLSFPGDLDLTAVPRALWWRIALICLHTHWAVLRPCQVHLPVHLGAGEREFWLRLIDNVAVQLEAYGSAPRPGRAAELVDVGPTLAPVPLAADGTRAALAFSGGRDSLTLAALLCELTERPILVTTTSPVPWARDNVGRAREELLSDIVERAPVELVEVHSDYRTCWRLDFSARDGCRLGVHELSDIPLFQAVTLAVAAASGAGQTFMASEADLQYNAARDGEVILHPEFLSCAATQSALDRLVRGFGLRQGSLTYALHRPQVQRLLVRRYRHLAPLQLSCWRAPEGARACNGCGKCFQGTLFLLAEGVSPRSVGIDAIEVLCAYGDWRLDEPPVHEGPALHELRSARHHAVRCLQQTATARVASIFGSDALTADDPRLGEALAVFARMRAEALALSVPPAPGYIAGFLELLEPELCGRVRTIFDQHFSPAPRGEFAEIVGRSRALAAWIGQPLAGVSDSVTRR